MRTIRALWSWNQRPRAESWSLNLYAINMAAGARAPHATAISHPCMVYSQMVYREISNLGAEALPVRMSQGACC